MPVEPSLTFQKSWSWAAVNFCFRAADVKSAGGGFRAPPAGPLPSPFSPWQARQLCVYIACPALTAAASWDVNGFFMPAYGAGTITPAGPLGAVVAGVVGLAAGAVVTTGVATIVGVLVAAGLAAAVAAGAGFVAAALVVGVATAGALVGVEVGTAAGAHAPSARIIARDETRQVLFAKVEMLT